MSNNTNKGLEELSEDDYWADFQGSYVPHESEDEPTEPKKAVAQPPAPEVTHTRNTNELIEELNQIVALSEGLHPSDKDLPAILSLLNYYKDRIAERKNWKEPMDPFPAYEQMTTKGKALWLLMHEVCCNNDRYGTNATEFNGVIDSFLDEFFKGVQRDPSKLSDGQREQLMDQLGIGDFLLYHYIQFRNTYPNIPNFSNSKD